MIVRMSRFCETRYLVGYVPHMLHVLEFSLSVYVMYIFYFVCLCVVVSASFGVINNDAV